MQSEISKLAATENCLREEIRMIVRHRVPRGMRLSWRMMFEIEDEAGTQGVPVLHQAAQLGS